MIDLFIFLAALAAIGIGVAMKDPASALIVVGGIVLGFSVLGFLKGGKR